LPGEWFDPLLLVVAGTGCGSSHGGMTAAKLERLLVSYHITPTRARCRAGGDGWDYVCTFFARGRLWKQGFTVAGERLTGGDLPVRVADHLSTGPWREPARRRRLVRLLDEVCARTPRRLARNREVEVVRLEALLPARLLLDFTVFGGAFAEVVSLRQEYRDIVTSGAPRRVVADVAARERAARAMLRATARRIGVDCG
jgi:hypothetical protein